jgi:hypothetical protein
MLIDMHNHTNISSPDSILSLETDLLNSLAEGNCEAVLW